MTLPIIALIGIVVISAGIGFATATLLAAGGRADLISHIIALRTTLKKAHEIIKEHHRMFGIGEFPPILRQIETTVQATFDDEIF